MSFQRHPHIHQTPLSPPCHGISIPYSHSASKSALAAGGDYPNLACLAGRHEMRDTRREESSRLSRRAEGDSEADRIGQTGVTNAARAAATES